MDTCQKFIENFRNVTRLGILIVSKIVKSKLKLDPILFLRRQLCLLFFQSFCIRSFLHVRHCSLQYWSHFVWLFNCINQVLFISLVKGDDALLDAVRFPQKFTDFFHDEGNKLFKICFANVLGWQILNTHFFCGFVEDLCPFNFCVFYIYIGVDSL